ncbi:MAG: phenylacetate--CoA ligase family protein [Oleiphilus sp.]
MYSWLFRKILFPLYETRIARRKTIPYILEYQGNIKKTRTELEKLQLEKLKLLLAHAYENCEFYRNQWDALGFDPSKVNKVSDISALPVLDKATIRENYQGIISQAHKSNIRKATGGSSGVPFQFELDQESNERRQAVMWRGYGVLGAGLGVKTLYLWGANIAPVGAKSALKDKLYHRFYNRKMLNSFKMTDLNMSDYVQEIDHYKPDALVSYVNPLVTLADYILEQNITIHQPNSILTGAEPLYEFQRKKIERAFKCPVYNTYGCREFMLIGAECQQQDGLHINIDHLVVELLDEQGEASSDSGDMVVTDLHNYGFPLIRYQNGDRASKSSIEACSCGSVLPLLKSIDGRKLDVIKTPDGRAIPGEFFPHLLKDFSSIKQFQIVQKSIDSISVNLVLYQENPAELKQIHQLISENTGAALNVNMNLLDDIPLTSSGKLRVTISEL